MSIQHDHPVTELIPRPEKTPAALKAALAIVAPDQLPTMRDDLEKAFNRAAETDSLTPVRAFLLHWSAVVEIERFPETAKGYHLANYLANHAATPEERRHHAVAFAAIFRNASEAVGA